MLFEQSLAGDGFQLRNNLLHMQSTEWRSLIPFLYPAIVPLVRTINRVGIFTMWEYVCSLFSKPHKPMMSVAFINNRGERQNILVIIREDRMRRLNDKQLDARIHKFLYR